MNFIFGYYDRRSKQTWFSDSRCLKREKVHISWDFWTFVSFAQKTIRPRSQPQHTAVFIFFEPKWADLLIPNMVNLEAQHNISRRILQRRRAQLAKLGL